MDSRTFRWTLPWVAVAILLLATSGCGDEEPSPGRGGAPAAAAERGAAPALGVRTGTPPADACGWLTIAEFEKLVGTLAGPPEPRGDECRYPLHLDSATIARKARQREADRRFLGDDAPSLRDTMWNKGGVILSVDLSADPAHEVGRAAAGRALDSWTSGLSDVWKRRAESAMKAEPDLPPPEGWDLAPRPRKNRDFSGRIGHVRILVSEQDLLNRVIPFEKKAALAALVRDRIPDLPFANPNGDQSVHMPATPDPCALLTRADAEAVLGPLVVDPYRVGETEPFVESNGRSCGYQTRNHRVLVVTPHWTDGKGELALVRGVGGLVSAVAPDAEGEAADTLEGPWDEVAVELDGSLAFLTGDRLLRISYITSPVDAQGAIRLARTALPRLASASPR